MMHIMTKLRKNSAHMIHANDLFFTLRGCIIWVESMPITDECENGLVIIDVDSRFIISNNIGHMLVR